MWSVSLTIVRRDWGNTAATFDQKPGGLTQVELANVRSFFNQAQKSPFTSFPWKTGTMHFHYVPEVRTPRRNA